jgi:hypothetical protein
MQEYRAYLLDAEGHVKDRVEFLAGDDQAALAQARQHIKDDHNEVWVLTRVIGRLLPTAH